MQYIISPDKDPALGFSEYQFIGKYLETVFSRNKYLIYKTLNHIPVVDSFEASRVGPGMLAGIDPILNKYTIGD